MFYDEKGLSADVRDQSMKTKHKYVLYVMYSFVMSHDMYPHSILAFSLLSHLKS